MGSSLGGLMSLAMGKLHPDIFGRIGAVSPTVMWAGSEIFRFWDSATGYWCKIYMDAGSLERYWLSHMYLDYVEATKAFYNYLKSLGMGDHELRHVIAENHSHNEEAWQARLPDIFQWLLEDARGI
jgi:predicted alpha/beta superfamily hydrolase